MKLLKKIWNAFWESTEMVNYLYPGYIQMCEYSYYPVAIAYPCF